MYLYIFFYLIFKHLLLSELLMYSFSVVLLKDWFYRLRYLPYWLVILLISAKVVLSLKCKTFHIRTWSPKEMHSILFKGALCKFVAKALQHHLWGYTSLLKWQHSGWTTAVNNVSIWTQHESSMSVDISGPFFDHDKYKLYNWQIDKGVRCPLTSLHMSSPVLGTVPEFCLCRDLELDCDRAQIPDIPLVAVNVTMMWVRNLFFFLSAISWSSVELSCLKAHAKCQGPFF